MKLDQETKNDLLAIVVRSIVIYFLIDLMVNSW